MTCQNTPNPTSEQPEATARNLEAVLGELTVDQIRFAIARQAHGTDKEAARAVGIPANTVKSWKADGAPIDEAVRLMIYDGVLVAKHLRRRNLARAMAIKVAGLTSDDETARQKAATEIIEWELGKATQKQELTGKDGKAIQTENTIRVVVFKDDETGGGA